MPCHNHRLYTIIQCYTVDMSLSDVHLCIKSPMLIRTVFGIGIASIHSPPLFCTYTTTCFIYLLWNRTQTTHKKHTKQKKIPEQSKQTCLQTRLNQSTAKKILTSHISFLEKIHLLSLFYQSIYMLLITHKLIHSDGLTRSSVTAIVLPSYHSINIDNPCQQLTDCKIIPNRHWHFYHEHHVMPCKKTN